MGQTEVRLLECEMTPEEGDEMLKSLPELLNRLDLAKDEKKRVTQKATDLVKSLEREIGLVRHALNTGNILRDVTCEWRGDLLYRTDTNKDIDTR